MKQRDGGTRTRVSSRSVDRPHTARPSPEGAAPRGGQHLAAVLERSPDVLFRLDRDLRHLFVSGNLSLLGRQRPEELLGKTAREAGLPEEAAALLEQAARRALETGEAQQADYPLAGAVLRSRLILELGEDGTVQSLIGITEDVTELRRAERHAAFVSALGETLSLITDPHEIARTVTRAVGEHLACHRCYFGEIDEVEGIVVVHPDWASDGAPSVAGRYRLTDLGSPELWRAVQGRRIAIEDVATDPLTPDVAAKYEAMQVRALANAGFASEGRWVVRLTVNHASPRSWREDELALLETLAARTWPLVLRARSEKALRGSEARWRFALQAARMVAWESDLSTRRTILSDGAAEVVGSRRCRSRASSTRAGSWSASPRSGCPPRCARARSPARPRCTTLGVARSRSPSPCLRTGTRPATSSFSRPWCATSASARRSRRRCATPTGARTSSSRCSPTSCATRSRRSATRSRS